MMIKNAIVLLGQINLEIEAGGTISGFIPLLEDVFWAYMAVRSWRSLTFGMMFIMVMVPVLNATLYRTKSPGFGVRTDAPVRDGINC